MRLFNRAETWLTVTSLIAVSFSFITPVNAQTNVRFATFNASLNRNAEGQILTDFSNGNNAQAKVISEIIQRVNPDVLLINEFDYLSGQADQVVNLFRQNYLSVVQNVSGIGGTSAVNYPFFYAAPSNTGIASNFDLNNDGQVISTPGANGYGDDALGFGAFPGQFGMLLLSKYEIQTADVRTFQNFKWKDMPGNRLPPGFYSQDEQNILPLSSKSHWDVPILVNGSVVHVLAAHPTPPVFDGPEDRNGRRNADEIRLWADYITPGTADYLYDDQNRFGGLASDASFVIMGDYNSDPSDGDSLPGAIQQLLNNPRVNTGVTPSSLGAPEHDNEDDALAGVVKNVLHLTPSQFDTADFSEFGTSPGNLRADYVLPSANLTITDAGVFWPQRSDPLYASLINERSSFATTPSSDHSLVFTNVIVSTAPEPGTLALLVMVALPCVALTAQRRNRR